MIMKPPVFILVVVLLLLLTSCGSQGSEQDDNWPDVVAAKASMKCRMYTRCTMDLLFRKTLDISQLAFRSNDPRIIEFVSVEACIESDLVNPCLPFSAFNVSSQLNNDDNDLAASYTVRRVFVEAKLIGNASLQVFATAEQGQQSSSTPLVSVNVFLSAPRRVVDILFDIWTWSFGAFISMIMGILLDRNSLMKILKMPKAIIIGFCCQYLCMPLMAFAIATIYKLPPVEALALFIYGCCPGGAGSNNWTIMFNGDLDLSAILTFVSTCSSLIMLPAWVYTLGRVFSTKANISIPVYGLLGNLVVTIVPCLIGLYLAYKFPKLKGFCLRIAKPFTLIVLISFFALVFITKWYILKLVKLRHWFSGPIIPWTGYVLGGLVSWILRLPINQCKTVAIETGIQNVGVAFLILFTNLPSPEADYAAMPIIAVATLTNAPLFLFYFSAKLIKTIKAKMAAKRSVGAQQQTYSEDEKKEETAEQQQKSEETKPMFDVQKETAITPV